MDLDDQLAYVDHPLWARFLRWCTIYPKNYETDNSHLVLLSEEERSRLEDLPDYKYTPLDDPNQDVRIVELLPGKFDDEIIIRIHHIRLTPPPQRGKVWKTTLAEVRRELSPDWEAFQTLGGFCQIIANLVFKIVDRRFFFRDMKTGKTQWEHPRTKLHPRRTIQYEVPPKDASFPQYETLSYVWGPSSKAAVITVDRPDKEGLARLAVTESLITALRYLRYPQNKRNLWIDAIVVSEGGTGLLFPAPNTKEEQWYDPDFELPYSDETWNAIISLMRRPWFNRLWVVQEIHPGAFLQVGHDKIALTSFSEAQYCLYCKTQLPPGIRWQMTQVDGTLSRFWTMALPRLLYRGAYKECTDPRDKIYGLLGLAPSRFAQGIKVDYEAANTAADVYRMATLTHAKTTQHLEHFHNCFTPKNERKIPEGPSWVPDWFSECPGESYIPSQFVTSTSRAHYRHSEDNPNLLELLGVRFGRVCHVTKPLPQRLEDRREAIHHIRQWQPADLDSARYGPTGEPLRKAYAITLASYGLREREPDWIVSSVTEWARQDFDDEEVLFGKPTTAEGSAAEPQESRPSSSPTTRQDVSDALQLCADRLFFRTDDGYVGLAPYDTQRGDIIAVPLGCPNALILRPSGTDTDAEDEKEKSNTFSVIGECFVYGLEDVISLLGRLPKPWIGIAAWGIGDRRFLNFVNTETKERTVEDPRLLPLDEWERVNKSPTPDDPTLFEFFRHKSTGEVINYDPRLEPQALEAKGVPPTWFSLI
ncbi:putative heterokaryon incompatibility protein [Colletotrichum sublineola]|uniref:Putative heterokaryon incompatibility protein n=1 Tax=Colletotrichum sublineola TaxID=1173701 RepID=A0A066XH49_COLSU|nr:putative heterokaryon incompatibility protein [Colletotrichum sublineola]